MALISLGMPVFNGTEEDDLDLFINLYQGYLASVGVNYRDRAGNPAGVKRAMGILRSCMQGPASLWFDRELTGKNWKIAHIHKNGTATLNAFRLLVIPQGAGGPNAGTYVAGSTAATYAGVAANALQTIGGAFIPSDTTPLTGQEARDAITMWNRCGAGPSTDPPNIIAPNNAGGGQNGRPIVFEGITPGQAFAWMRQHLPALIEERRRLRFSSLSQENLPVREYYDKVCRAGQLLGFTDVVIDDQFFRGLSADNIIEIERIGSEKPAKDLTDILERVEKRKAEMHLGLTSRKAREEHFLKVEPIQKPPVTRQEPVEIKPVTSHAITQDMMNKLLQQHTENLTKTFQAQLQTLQEKVSQPVSSSSQPVRPPVPPKNTRNMQEYYERSNPYQDDSQWNMEDVMGSAYPKPIMKIAERVARNMARAKERQEDRELARAMRDLTLRDHEPEPMDIDVLRIGDVEISRDDLNEFIVNLVRSKKK